MKQYTTLFLSLLTFCSFLTSTSYAQEEKDYFITVWDLSTEKSTTIEFYALTTGDVNYTWETIPAGESGSGKFNRIDEKVEIANLPSKQIKLKLSPQNLKRFYFPIFSNYNSKLVDVAQWGSAEWTSMENAFYSCVNLNITCTDIPNLIKVNSMEKMFYVCEKLNGPTNIYNWKTLNVNNMNDLFWGAKSFNQNIGGWVIAGGFFTMYGILTNSGMDCKNYTNTLIGWASNKHTAKNTSLDARGLKYSSLAQHSRDQLTTYNGWSIYGDALSTEDCGLVTSQVEGEEQSSIALYPNPAQETLYLKNAPLGTKYSIFDGLGRLVSTGQCQNEAIDISALASGLYSLRLGNKQYNFVKE